MQAHNSLRPSPQHDGNARTFPGPDEVRDSTTIHCCWAESSRRSDGADMDERLLAILAQRRKQVVASRPALAGSASLLEG